MNWKPFFLASLFLVGCDTIVEPAPVVVYGPEAVTSKYDGQWAGKWNDQGRYGWWDAELIISGEQIAGGITLHDPNRAATTGSACGHYCAWYPLQLVQRTVTEEKWVAQTYIQGNIWTLEGEMVSADVMGVVIKHLKPEGTVWEMARRTTGN